MSEEKNNFENWAEVIADFLQRKIEAEEERYLKDVIKLVAEQYSDQKYFKNTEIEIYFDPKKNKKNDSQSSLDFQRLKFKNMFEFDEKPEELNQFMIEESYSKHCAELTEKYKPHTWIAKAAKDAPNVKFATHVSKLTHSKIDSPSFYDQVLSQKEGILATSDLQEKIIDGAVSGNQFAPVFQFFELELNGNKLASIFNDESNTVLQSFTKKPEDLGLWNTGFKQSFADCKVSSHFLAKQVYFSITTKDPLSAKSYHLLCNVKSSSLAHAIFEKLRETEQEKIKKTLDKNKYTKLPKTSFLGRATIKVTASNHGNASQLNAKRGGKIELFSSLPPNWERQVKPPIYHTSLFYAGFSHQSIKENVEYLKDFLFRFERINLSIKDPKKKKWIDGWMSNIIDDVLLYAASIQNLPAGWSNTEMAQW
jgi:CRISPR-associated protein Csy1